MQLVATQRTFRNETSHICIVLQAGLAGPLPSQIVGLMTKLYSFNARFTALSGLIPSQVGMLQDLLMYSAQNTPMSGSLPESFFQLTNLRFFTNAKSRFESSVPEEISGWKQMKFFSSVGNGLTGTLPPDLFFTLTSLCMLDLMENNLSGTLSTSFGQLKELQFLRLDNTLLSGTVPSELGLLTHLVDLFLSTAMPRYQGDVAERLVIFKCSSSLLCGIGICQRR